MISFLRGKVASVAENSIELDCNGVGYKLTATMGCMSKFGESTEEIIIPTYMAIREDDVSLYGFENNNEKNMFLKLITVSGVGPKLGVTILSGAKAEDLCVFIATGNVDNLSRIKGLGKKTAERIIVELKEKVAKVDGALNVSSGVKLTNNEAIEDACVALTTLGLSKTDAYKLIEKVVEPTMNAEEIIKKCLKFMAK